MLPNDLVVTKLLRKLRDTADNKTYNDDSPNSVWKDKSPADIIGGKEVSESDGQYCYITKVQS